MINSSGAPITGLISFTGTATDGADYTMATTVFSIPTGMNSTTVIVPVIDDALIECDETVIATISSPSAGSIGTASATAIIVDDECTTQFTVSIGNPVDGTEGATDVSFDVFLDGGAINNTGAAITGLISFLGTATATSDYASVTSGFSIANGTNSTTLVLSVIDDALFECDETVIATISNLNVGVIGNPTDTALIIDDECGQLTISIESPTDGTEGLADASFVISLDNGLINGTGGPIVGMMNMGGGTAIPGVDFVDSATFAIPDGASFVQYDIYIIDDTIVEPTETIVATISSPSYGSINATAYTDSTNILDNDSTSSVALIEMIELDVYPNPTSSILNVSSERQIVNYSITDENGRRVLSEKANATSVVINMETLTSGCYFLSLELEDGTSVSRKVSKK